MKIDRNNAYISHDKSMPLQMMHEVYKNTTNLAPIGGITKRFLYHELENLKGYLMKDIPKN